MPTDLVRRVDLDLIYPPFRAAVFEVLAECRKRGHDFYWTSGTRWYDEQAKLRQLYREGKGGKAAPPGLSGHQYGLSGDFTHDSDLSKPGLQPDWKLPNYTILGEAAALAGLAWGNRYNDSPHLNWPGWESGSQLAVLRKIWLSTPGPQLGRLHTVWRYLDTQGAA